MSAPSSHGHPDDAELGPPTTVEVADGVFAYVQPDGSWWINNTGFLVDGEASRVVAIDTCSTERRTRAFLSAVATRSDVVAWLAEDSVLFAGDLVFNGGTPFVVMGSVAGSLGAITALRSLGASTIVPGHGGVCGPEALDRVEAYLRWVTGLAASAKSAGLSPLEAAREADLGEFAELLDSERLVGNLHRAYAELDGADPGAPIDYLAAFDDMIAFNGGRPLRCLA